MSWRVTGSRHVLKDRWFSVRSDDCVTPSGMRIAPYYVVDVADFVHVVALDREGRIVLVRQYRHGLGGPSLELPGGNMDEADGADPVVTGLRELREETGYTDGRAEHVIALTPDPARYANRIHLVLVRDAVPGPASPDPGESLAVELVSRDEARRLAVTGGIMNAQHVGLLTIALARLDDGAEASSLEGGTGSRQ